MVFMIKQYFRIVFLSLLIIFLITRFGFSVTVGESNGIVTINNGHLSLSITLSNGTWTGTLDGTNVLKNITGSFSSGGGTSSGFTGWSQSDLNNALGTGKEIVFNINGGGTLTIRTYDNDYFFTVKIYKSGSSGTGTFQGNLLSGTPNNPMVWYADGDYNNRPMEGPLGSSSRSTKFAISGWDGYNRPGIIVGTVDISVLNQQVELSRASDGLGFRAWGNISNGNSPVFAIGVTYRVVEQMERYAEIVGVVNQITLSQWIPCGFCTWDAYNNNITPNDVYAACDQLVSTRLKEYGYNLVQIDDGWQYGWRQSGSWWANSTFGGGSSDNNAMANVATQIHNRGLKAGLWIGPLGDEDNPDWRPQCWGCQNPNFTTPPYNLTCPPGGPQKYDMNNTNFLNYAYELSDRITNRWGYEYVKFDFMNDWAGNGSEIDFRNAYIKFRSGMKSGAFFTYSNSFQWLALNTIDATRSGDDVSCDESGNPFNFSRDDGIVPAVRAASLQWYMNRKMWITDIDQVHVKTPPLSDGQARIWATLVGISGGLILTGDKFWQLPANRLDMLKRIAPPYGVAARPVDLFEHNVSARDFPTIFVMDVKKTWGNYYVMSVINWSTSQTNKTIDFAQRLGTSSSQEFLVYDYWNNTFLGTKTGTMQLTIPGHDVYVLSIVPKGTIPQIVSTSRHISQGGIDLQNVSWNGSTKQLTGTSANLVTNVQYTMAIFCPTGYSISNGNAGGNAMTVQVGSDGVTRVSFTPTSTNVNWTVNFSGGSSDTTPPATVTDLSAGNPTSTSITLTWTAPGDDGNIGTATLYDIRYSLNSITTDTAFNNAIQCNDEPVPTVAGTKQSFTVNGLNSNTTYYFALKTVDESGNWSGLSNCPSAKTLSAGTVPTKILLFADPSSILPDGVSTSTITANVCDSGNNIVQNSSATITFSKTGSGTFVGQNPVNAVNGVAKIVYRSGTTAETVQITATSPGLTQGSVNVLLSTNKPPNPPTNLKTNNILTPAILNTTEVTFSWTFSDPDSNDTQSAYQIILANNQSSINNNTGNVWDTNKKLGSSNSERYLGAPLSTNVTYYWKIRTWDNHDSAGPYSIVGTFIVVTNPVIWLSTNTLDFGTLDAGQTQTLTFEITNIGAGTLDGILSADQEWIIIDRTNFSLNKNQSISVNVTVDNSVLNQTEGEWTGKILIDSNGGTETIDVVVTATCVLVKPNPYNPNKGLLTFFGSGIVPGETTIKIYTLSGELVKQLSSESGKELIWDGKTDNSEPVANGIYLYTYDSPKEKGIGKFTIINK